jgi:hypothetical protein
MPNRLAKCGSWVRLAAKPDPNGSGLEPKPYGPLKKEKKQVKSFLSRRRKRERTAIFF